MAQLRQDYEEFAARDAVILVVGPDGRAAFERYWEKEDLPFIGLPDPQHTIAGLYDQQVKLLKLGRMPALMVIDKHGRLHLAHYGQSMQDIPPDEQVLTLLDAINGAA